MAPGKERRVEEAESLVLAAMLAGPDPAVVARLRAAGCVFAEEEALLLGAEAPQRLAELLALRESGVPLEQALGWALFCGRRIALEPGVFVPRRRTEFLAEQALSLAVPGALVLDLCCGSGAVATALVAHGLDAHAVDIDAAAVRCARRNLPAHPAQVHLGDLYEPLPLALRGRVDLIVANAPYVPTAELGLLPPEARLHEPPVALDGGSDGLDVARRVVAGAPPWLVPAGHLLVESSARQAAALAAAMAAAGFAARAVASADLGATVVIGTLGGGHPAVAG